MKRILSLFKSFRPKSSNIRVTDTSQPHRLMYAMAAAGIKHGDRVIADIGPVQLSVDTNNKTARAYMCNIRGVQIHKIVEMGDAGSLPMKVTFKGFNVKLPEKGINHFRLKNVELYSNGTIQVIANEDTVIEPYEPLKERHDSYRDRFYDRSIYRY